MAKSQKQPIAIHTDGACIGNPGPGGWAAQISQGKRVKVFKGGQAEATNNQMELLAAIKALEALKRPLAVTVFTDSEYVQKGISGWIENWKANGWRTSGRKPVKNVELWKRLDSLCQIHDVAWRWVKGHAGNKGNERVDKLAYLEAKRFMEAA
ncbi:ribonuclease HI [Thalassospira sp. GO-4]|uniref:ribonuclease HI n=1 Tax=Thalassospira sp. GO-4 TaxID=2946605 RepID=UPI0020258828|nr:ribonuclease HI [Thalassospira sp. GO-4]URK16948.1 ribonuclease HI [Thalassospira sp. GO-4]